jgi:hypothetical protein
MVSLQYPDRWPRSACPNDRATRGTLKWRHPPRPISTAWVAFPLLLPFPDLNSPMAEAADLMDKLVSLCKRRGYIFQVLRDLWRHRLGLGLRSARGRAQAEREGSVVDLRWSTCATTSRDSTPPSSCTRDVWEASGPRRRLLRSAHRVQELQAPLPRRPPRGAGRQCPVCGTKDAFGEARQFNLMFKTSWGRSRTPRR